MQINMGKVDRVWRYPGYEGGVEDALILVDGQQIGGSYWCGADYIRDGQRWASYGPAGLSMHHPDRETAEQVQVREYATNPDLYDRVNAQARAERAAEQEAEATRREEAHARAEEARRRRRCGDDEPGPTLWTLPAYHVLYAPEQETQQVREWLAANGIDAASGTHEIRIEQRATRRVVAYEAPESARIVTRDTATKTHVVTLVAEPPTIATPARPDLHELLEEHWPTQFPLIDYGRTLACPVCTRAAGSVTSVVPWPCEKVTAAIGEPEHAH